MVSSSPKPLIKLSNKSATPTTALSSWSSRPATPKPVLQQCKQLQTSIARLLSPTVAISPASTSPTTTPTRPLPDGAQTTLRSVLVVSQLKRSLRRSTNGYVRVDKAVVLLPSANTFTVSVLTVPETLHLIPEKEMMAIDSVSFPD